MTKLGLLNAYLTERLMVAVREILEVVEGTVGEYQEEAARTHRENENLRRRLREVGLDTGTNWPAHPLSVSEGRSPLEQQHSEQEWSSGLREELAVNEEVHFCERQREQSCDPGLVLPDYDSAGSLPTAPHVKSDQDDTSSQPPDLYKIQIVSATGAYSPPGVATAYSPPAVATAYSPPGVAADSIKTEPSEVYCGLSEQPARSFSPEMANPEGNTAAGALVSGEGAEPPLQSENKQPDGKSKSAYRKTSHNCPHCEKTFRHVSRLKIHLRIHTGEKPFSCSLCGKCFNNDGTLKNHQRVHMQVRMYSCKECGMSFKDAYTCKKHQRVHTGEKPYQCVHCGKHFNEVGNLQAHIRTHTGERPYCCTLCGKRFLESGKLKKHLRIHTRGNTQS